MTYITLIVLQSQQLAPDSVPHSGGLIATLALAACVAYVVLSRGENRK